MTREIEIKYCLTHEMYADYMTKPLIGTKFKKFRNHILNGESISWSASSSVLEYLDYQDKYSKIFKENYLKKYQEKLSLCIWVMSHELDWAESKRKKRRNNIRTIAPYNKNKTQLNRLLLLKQ